MLQKLLKYDFKALRRFGIPAIIALAALIPVSGVGAYFYIRWVEALAAKENEAATVISSATGILLFLGCIGILYVAMIGIFVMILVDFYRSTATDEAYLTFTLPVTPRQIIASKTINAFLWQFVIGLLAVAAGLSLVIGLAAGMSSAEAVSGAIDEIPEYFYIDNMMTSKVVALVVIYILMTLVGVVSTTIANFTAIFFGSVIAKKHKVLSALGCMLGVYALNAMVGSIIQTVATVVTIGPAFDMITPYIITYAVLTVFHIGMVFVYYFILKGLMTRRLNLQ